MRVLQGLEPINSTAAEQIVRACVLPAEQHSSHNTTAGRTAASGQQYVSLVDSVRGHHKLALRSIPQKQTTNFYQVQVKHYQVSGITPRVPDRHLTDHSSMSVRSEGQSWVMVSAAMDTPGYLRAYLVPGTAAAVRDCCPIATSNSAAAVVAFMSSTEQSIAAKLRHLVHYCTYTAVVHALCTASKLTSRIANIPTTFVRVLPKVRGSVMWGSSQATQQSHNTIP